MFNLGTHLCHFSCLTCTKSLDLNACSTCKPGYSLSVSMCQPIAPPGQVVSGGSPAGSCPANHYKSFDMVCTSCSASCANCNNFTGYCSECNPGFKIDPFGKCIASCTGMYGYIESSKDYCGRCHPSCATCNGGTSNNCSTCDAAKSFTQSGTTCIDRCVGTASANTSYLMTNDTCAQCIGVGSCKQCTYPGLGFSCTLCSGGYFMYNGYCTSTCPEGLIANNTTMKCESCEESASNKIFHNGSCILNTACPSGYTLTGLKCLNLSIPQAPTNSSPFDSPSTPTTMPLNTTTPLNTSTSSPAKSTDSQTATSSSSSGYFIYIIIALAVVSFVVGGAICYLRRKRLTQAKARHAQVHPAQNANNVHAVNGRQDDGRQQSNDDDEDDVDGDWNIPDSQPGGRNPRQLAANAPPPMEIVNFSKSNVIVKGLKPGVLSGESANDWNLPETSGPRNDHLMMSGITETNVLSHRANIPGTNQMEAGFAMQASPPRRFVPRRTDL